MSKTIIAIIVVIIIAVGLGYWIYQSTIAPEELTEKEQACVNSGGQALTSLCCKTAGDFPNLCLVGSCGCSPDNSHKIKICDCGPDRCFNGNECVSPKLTQDQIIVKQSSGAFILPIECMDRNYISDKADYIIEGTVEKVEVKEVNKGEIFTYSDILIEKYLEGTPFDSDKMQIVTPGGCIEEICLWIEDQPIFNEGKKVRIYLQETNGEFSIVCAHSGVTAICRTTNESCTPTNVPCCQGLKEVNLCFFNEEGQVICALCGTICVPCGNDICDENENKDNCPEDCK
ncbi:hypothetical protein ACFL0A_01610 [Patescibacteria group bacterium]